MRAELVYGKTLNRASDLVPEVVVCASLFLRLHYKSIIPSVGYEIISELLFAIIKVCDGFHVAESCPIRLKHFFGKTKVHPSLRPVDEILNELKIGDLGEYIWTLDGLRSLECFSELPSSWHLLIVDRNIAISEIKKRDLLPISKRSEILGFF